MLFLALLILEASDKNVNHRALRECIDHGGLYGRAHNVAGQSVVHRVLDAALDILDLPSDLRDGLPNRPVLQRLKNLVRRRWGDWYSSSRA